MVNRSIKGDMPLNKLRRRIAWLALILLMLLATSFLVLGPSRGPHTLLNVSYDGSRGFYREVNEAYARKPGAVTVEMSRAASARQARNEFVEQ